MNRQLAFLSVYVFFLSSCAHMPFSTMFRMSRFGIEEFVALNPEDIRAKVEIWNGPSLQEDHSKITFSIEKTDGKFDDYNFPLEFVARETIPASVASNEKQETSIFRLSLEGAESMRQLQQTMRTNNLANYEGFRLSVITFFKERPPENETTSMSIQLKMKENEEYFTLVKNVKLPEFKKEGETQGK